MLHVSMNFKEVQSFFKNDCMLFGGKVFYQIYYIPLPPPLFFDFFLKDSQMKMLTTFYCALPSESDNFTTDFSELQSTILLKESAFSIKTVSVLNQGIIDQEKFIRSY